MQREEGLTIYSIYIRPAQLLEEFLFWPPAEIKRWDFFLSVSQSQTEFIIIIIVIVAPL